MLGAFRCRAFGYLEHKTGRQNGRPALISVSARAPKPRPDFVVSARLALSGGSLANFVLFRSYFDFRFAGCQQGRTDIPAPDFYRVHFCHVFGALLSGYKLN
ncbi:MAG: hypothetical protein KIT09_32445, partial [Bryobacteraceae bacterium]|nr:hypothetical protein [Bryobacteraceae bacterium]